MASEDKKKALSILEGIFVRSINNNGRQIRYPITFEDGTHLKVTMGRNVRLNTDDISIEKMISGKYIFGANKVLIFEALKNVIDYVEDKTGADVYFDIANPLDD